MSTVKYDMTIAVLEVDCAHSTWCVYACQSSLLALRARFSYIHFFSDGLSCECYLLTLKHFS